MASGGKPHFIHCCCRVSISFTTLRFSPSSCLQIPVRKCNFSTMVKSENNDDTTKLIHYLDKLTLKPNFLPMKCNESTWVVDIQVQNCFNV